MTSPVGSNIQTRVLFTLQATISLMLVDRVVTVECINRKFDLSNIQGDVV
jgi:hypothetical protein